MFVILGIWFVLFCCRAGCGDRREPLRIRLCDRREQWL